MDNLPKVRDELTQSQNKEVSNKGNENVALVLDCSGSMKSALSYNSPNPKPKIDILIDSVLALIGNSSPDLTNYSVITFSNTAENISPMGNDFSLIQGRAIEGIHGFGTTSFCAGLSTALIESPNRMILFSDGEPTESESDIIDLVVKIAEKGIIIDTIAIGEANDALMAQIAAMTGGKFTHANSAEEMIEAFVELETSNYLQLEDHTIKL